MEQEKINPELKEIILYRLLSSKLPDNIQIAIGNSSDGPMNMQEIIQHVKDEDETGRTIIEMELNYLKALKEGILFS